MRTLRELGAAKLAGMGGRVHLAAWPPDGAEFGGFCEIQGLSAARIATGMARLTEDLRLVKPKPARLLATLRQVFGAAQAAGR